MMQYTQSLDVFSKLIVRYSPELGEDDEASDLVSIYIQDCTDFNDYYVLCHRTFDGLDILVYIDSTISGLDSLPIYYFEGHHLYYKIYKQSKKQSYHELVESVWK